MNSLELLDTEYRHGGHLQIKFMFIFAVEI